jgi:hypothetical protein
MKKLADILLYYHAEKVDVSAWLEDPLPDTSIANLESVKKTLQKFRTAVKQVDMETYEGLEDDYELVEYAITRLEKFFRMRRPDDESKIEARIFSHFLRDKYRALERLAQELDEQCQDLS